MGRLNYSEVAKGRIKEQRNLVISEVSDRDGNELGCSIAEQLVTEEGGKEVKLFLKGGLGIVSKEGLLQIKSIVDCACDKLGLLTDVDKAVADEQK